MEKKIKIQTKRGRRREENTGRRVIELLFIECYANRGRGRCVERRVSGGDAEVVETSPRAPNERHYYNKRVARRRGAGKPWSRAPAFTRFYAYTLLRIRVAADEKEKRRERFFDGRDGVSRTTRAIIHVV